MAWFPEHQPPPGWYPDPGGQLGSRWWDGGQWTPSLALYPPYQARPSVGPAPAAPSGSEEAPKLLPARAAWWGLAGFVIGFLASGILQLISNLVFPGSGAAQTLFGEIGLWSGMGGTCVMVSRRYGTGSLVRDFGVRFRTVDLGYGPLAALVCVIVAGVVGGLFHGSRFAGSNTNIITSQKGNTVGVAIVAIIASVGAPVFEELFFRGFLRLSLASRLGLGAVWAQAVLFGLAHTQPDLGIRNVSVCFATASIGLVLGYTAHLTRRLGPGMIAHGMFNLFVTLIIIGVI